MQPQFKTESFSKLTIAEYLKLEQENEQRYEYYDGYAYAMAGGTAAHGRISMNISGEVYMALRGRGNCEIMNSDAKLYLENKNSYVYPDAMTLCNAEESEEIKGAFTNPVVIIEVVSESTEAYDRGDKFGMYRGVESLKHYVLIKQDEAKIDVYSKQDVEKNRLPLWMIQTIEGLEGILELEISPSEIVKIPLARIYDRVVFEGKKSEETEKKEKK